MHPVTAGIAAVTAALLLSKMINNTVPSSLMVYFSMIVSTLFFMVALK